jgi:hypothetical protein
MEETVREGCVASSVATGFMMETARERYVASPEFIVEIARERCVTSSVATEFMVETAERGCPRDV